MNPIDVSLSTAIFYLRLRDVLLYDRVTGVFVWRVARGNKAAGARAGCTDKQSGYVRINVDGTLYHAHRLAWLYVFGEWPPHEIDHKDTVRNHNWIKNLRSATKAENGQNRRLPSRNNRSGLLGVSFEHSSGKYVAQLIINGKFVHKSRHDTRELAYAAYVEHKEKLHPFSTIGALHDQHHS